MYNMFFCKKIVVFVLILFVNILAFGQSDNSLKGFVYEKSTGEPVMFCNVYLKGTTYGCSTDINGYFSITKIPDGKYDVIVTFLGYDTIKDPVELRNNVVINKKYMLTESSVQLEAVSVTAEKIEARTETKTSVVNITPKTFAECLHFMFSKIIIKVCPSC